jgi:hypothetical protein
MYEKFQDNSQFEQMKKKLSFEEKNHFYNDESNLAHYNITWCHHGDGLDATIGSLFGFFLTLIRSFLKHLVQVQWVKHHGFTFFLVGGGRGFLGLKPCQGHYIHYLHMN